MKAIRVNQFGGPEVMRLEEVPDPLPASTQVLVQVHAAGVNPVDTYLRSGSNPNLALPYTPGMDAAGTVKAIGTDVSRIHVGSKIYVAGKTGAYAEQMLCEESQVHPLPAHLTYAQGAGVNVPYATAYRALFERAHALAGETVLVHGATGGVGIAAVQLARAAGLTVIGTGSTEHGRLLVAEQGAHHMLDHRTPNYLQQIIELTEGRGVDIILEMLANVNLGKDLNLLASRGRVVVIGNRGTVEINPRDAMSRDATIIAMSLMNATAAEMASIHRALAAGLENKTLRPVINREMPLAEAAQAHEAVMGSGARGKIVLIP